MKKCFKCGQEKELCEFYTHPMMADGHLGKCKDCSKKDVMAHREVKLGDPQWVAAERERCRNRMAAARADGLKEDPKKIKARIKAWNKRNRHKRNAQNLANKAQVKGVIIKPESCQDCGVVTIKLQKHHPDYSQPLNVEWVCTKCHGIKTRKKDTVELVVKARVSQLSLL